MTSDTPPPLSTRPSSVLYTVEQLEYSEVASFQCIQMEKSMKVLSTLPNFAQFYLVFQAEKNQETIVYLHDSPQFYIPCSSPNLGSFFLPLLFSLFFSSSMDSTIIFYLVHRSTNIPSQIWPLILSSSPHLHCSRYL